MSDNGIGMSRQEVIDQIGTIAKSGTREFFQSLTSDKAKDAHLIGQFGVGFYSAFIVADRVTLTTRRAGLTAEHGVRWESSGEGEYTVETVTRESRGTDVVLHLRPEEDELLAGFKLREILRKYSDHITVPIVMKKEQWDSHGEGAGHHGRGRTDQSGVGAVGALQVRDHRRAVRRVLQARRRTTSSRRSRTCTPRSKAARNTRCCSTCRNRRRSICGTASIAAASSSTSVACSSWTMRSS